MKIFLVTRGSHGDIFPYLAVATELTRRGHYVTLSLPLIFEEEAKKLNLNYVLQASDDIVGVIEDLPEPSKSFNHILKWIRRVIDNQFEEFIPVLKEHDIFVSANTEFAAVSIAEYCEKPIIRTAYAPLIPGRKIPPPIVPLSDSNKIFTPTFMWSLLNRGTDFMVRKTLNKNRKSLGMPPIKKYAPHAAGNAYNYLMHSNYLGNTDPDWKYRWMIGGYCFNNSFEYDENLYTNVLDFIKKDDKPVIFFTLGSCDAKKKDFFCKNLLDICNEDGYKLIVGSGWCKTGSNLEDNENLFIMDKAIPHKLIFPYCDAVIHHGGSGTTHSVASAAKPQMIIPLLIDQGYWALRVKELGTGPGKIKITIPKQQLRKKINDLVYNQKYKDNAATLAKKVNGENGINNLCNYIESFSNAI
ncbi:glycosyltransferase [Prevotella sp. 10(H)]|uniref:glycosyltransferase n=1 Tax=Prevotella sp. 10(H) TaxID=1158294 RepID=UPI0004A6D698|nr:glycosyltransferase [Prevotella sp. 10(H)]